MAASVQCALAYSFSQMTISHLSARGIACFSEPCVRAICPFPKVHSLAFLAVTHGAWKFSPVRFLVPHNKQKWNKLKTSDFCGPGRRLKSLWNLEVQVNSESDSQDQPTWAGTRMHSLRVECPGSPHSIFISPSRILPIITQIWEKSQTVGVLTSERGTFEISPVFSAYPINYTLKEKNLFFWIEGGTVSQMWQPPQLPCLMWRGRWEVGFKENFPKLNPSGGHYVEAQRG